MPGTQDSKGKDTRLALQVLTSSHGGGSRHRSRHVRCSSEKARKVVLALVHTWHVTLWSHMSSVTSSIKWRWCWPVCGECCEEEMNCYLCKRTRILGAHLAGIPPGWFLFLLFILRILEPVMYLFCEWEAAMWLGVDGPVVWSRFDTSPGT